MTFPMTLGDL